MLFQFLFVLIFGSLLFIILNRYVVSPLIEKIFKKEISETLKEIEELEDEIKKLTDLKLLLLARKKSVKTLNELAQVNESLESFQEARNSLLKK